MTFYDAARPHPRDRALLPAEREACAIRLVVEIGRAFRYAGEPWSAAELAGALRVPVRTVRDVLVPLQQARIVSRVEEEHKQDAFQLGQSADRLPCLGQRSVAAARRQPSQRPRRCSFRMR